MTKRLSAFLIFATVMAGVLAPAFSYAAPFTCDCTKLNEMAGGDLLKCSLACTGKGGGLVTDEEKQYQSEDIARIIGQVINTILMFLGVIFMVLVVYSGATWMLAAGETEKIEGAKDTLKSSIIGVLVVISAYVIMNFVFSQLLLVAFS